MIEVFASVGALLLVTGVIGGGLEFKGAKVPKVGTASRAAAFVVGAGCLLLALGMHFEVEGALEEDDDGFEEDPPAADIDSEPDPDLAAQDDEGDLLNGTDPSADDGQDGQDWEDGQEPALDDEQAQGAPGEFAPEEGPDWANEDEPAAGPAQDWEDDTAP